MSNDSLKKLFQRKKTPDGTPDWEAIEAHITCRGKKAAAALSEGTTSREDQIAALEAYRNAAYPGSKEWEQAEDALRRLQRRQLDGLP